MDSTRAILESHYPRCRWTRLGTHWSGRCGSVMVAVYHTNAGWCADGQTEVGAAVHHSTGQNMHAALMNLVSFSPKFIDALNPTPYEQPQSTPFPAMMARVLPGCLGALVWVAAEAVWLRRWHLLLFGMALACGALGMWTITGGAR